MRRNVPPAKMRYEVVDLLYISYHLALSPNQIIKEVLQLVSPQVSFLHFASHPTSLLAATVSAPASRRFAIADEK